MPGSKLGSRRSWDEQLRPTDPGPAWLHGRVCSPEPLLPCIWCLRHPSPGRVQPTSPSLFLYSQREGVKPAKSCKRDIPARTGTQLVLGHLAAAQSPVCVSPVSPWPGGACAGGQLVSSLGAAVGKRGAVGCRCVAGSVAGSLGSGWLTRKHFSLCAFSMLEKRKRWPHTSHG